mmetsp:Transcript_17946/g.36174  ORF Transcript_17946/g.36174 Transcript_17946/m.36174 type:complete len:423 (-) Transcript_17946:516-1784(-)
MFTMIRMLPRFVVYARHRPSRLVSPKQVSAAFWRWSSDSASSLPPEPNALDRSILKLASDGAEHLPRLFQDMVDSEVYYITQNSAEITVQDALTFPSNNSNNKAEDGALYPAFFSSAWAIERYLEQQNLKHILREAVIHPIAAREFLQQTRPALLLFNPPVFTLAPDLIEQILKGQYDIVKPETAKNGTHTVRRELTLVQSQCNQTTQLPPSEVMQDIQAFLECQSTIVAAYYTQIEGGDGATPELGICCLCSMIEVEAFGSVEKDLRKVLASVDGGQEYSTLCLNYMPMDTFESIMDRFTPFYLNLGKMSDVEFDLFLGKLSVGRARPPSHKDRDALLQRLMKEELHVQAAYQLVYQISGYPTTGRIGTFLDAGQDPPPSQNSLRECLHRGWGFLHELPPEMADFCRNNLEPVYIASSDDS